MAPLNNYILAIGTFLFGAVAKSQDTYIVRTSQLKTFIQPTMWGLFYEDLNRSADGGLYAELVKNRSFDFPDAFMGWYPEPARRMYAKNDIFQVINQAVTNENNPKYLQVTLRQGQGDKPEKVQLMNEGFGGYALKKGMPYELTFVYRQHTPGITLKVDLLKGTGTSVGSSLLPLLGSGNDWQTAKAIITVTDTSIKGKLLITFEGTGKIDIDRISLFPSDTWKNRQPGLRNDLAQLLNDIQPGFFRFPGGCIVEGADIATRYQWKKTIGPLSERKLNANQWSTGGPSGKPMKDYFQSYGLGFYEYFQLSEDMKAEPMPILNCGISCQFGTGEVVPHAQMDEYVQDALDLIEFANGSATTKWGKVRTSLGHPAPFNMKYLGIGNENWGPQYVERLELFTKTIKAKYPYIQLVTSTGYSPNPQFKYMDSVLRKMEVDIIDEHYYQTPSWFLMNAGKYDNYDRNGPKILIGEYACHSKNIGSPENKNTQMTALAEAAWMTGLERNADIVTMTAYAPLFAHVNDWQWTPNLIWFDNSSSYATPSYYVQKMFGNNRGTHVVGMDLISGQDSVWGSAVIDKNTHEVIVKLVNPSGIAKQKTLNFTDLKKDNTSGTRTVLQSVDPVAMNSIENPITVAPVMSTVNVKNKKLLVDMAPYSFNVVRIKM